MQRRRYLLASAVTLGVAGCSGQGGDDSGGSSTDGQGGTDESGTDTDQGADTAETDAEASDEEVPTETDGDAEADEDPDRGPITTDTVEAQETTFVIPGERFLDDEFEDQSSYSLTSAEVAITGGTWVDGGSVTRSEPVALEEAIIFAPADIWERNLPELESALDGIDRLSARLTEFPARELVDRNVHVYEGTDLESALDGDVPESEVVSLLEASSAVYDDELRDAGGTFREAIENGYVFVTGDRYFPGNETGRGDTLFPSGTQFQADQWIGGEGSDTESAAFSSGELIAGSFFSDRTAYVRGTGNLEAHLDDRQQSMYEDWLTLLEEGGVLLPPGSWAEGTDLPGATPTPTATPEPTANWPDDPAFTPNADVQGPGGDVVMSMAVEITDSFAAGEIETFEVEFDRIDLYTADGDTVPVQADVTVDFLAFDSGTDITIIFDVDIPANRYVEIDFYMDPIEIVHEEDGDVTDLYENPPRMDVGSDRDEEGVEVNGGDGLRLDPRADVRYEISDYVRLEDDSVGALATGIQGVATNPDRFDNDDEG